MKRFIFFVAVFGLASFVSASVFAEYEGPDLRIPLSRGDDILCTVEAGGEVAAVLGGGTDSWHTGNGYYSLDFDNRVSNEPIVAAASGHVETVNNGGTGCYQGSYDSESETWLDAGIDCYVEIDHGEGYTTWYHHMENNSILVSEGDFVEQGQIIGTMGTTGYSTGTHLHFQIKHNGTSAQATSSSSDLYSVALEGISFEDYNAGENYQSSNLDFFKQREDSELLHLNPFSSQSPNTTVLTKLGGSRDGEFHLWFEDDTIGPDSEGVWQNAYVQDYTGGSEDGAIIVHPDSSMAVEIYGRMWEAWASSSGINFEDRCGQTWVSGGYGPRSQFGLPITGYYYDDQRGMWRQDFQRGFMLWDEDYNIMYEFCYAYAPPGWKSSGWDGAASAAVAQAYERNGGSDVVGYAFDAVDDPEVGDEEYLHEWSDGVWLQNFEGAVNDSGSPIMFSQNTLYNPQVNSASLVRDGFWARYYSGESSASGDEGPSEYGAPLGDEMDTTGTLHGYDPLCDDNEDGWVSLSERQGCIDQCCWAGGGVSIYTSMQRFEQKVFCYNPGDGQTYEYANDSCDAEVPSLSIAVVDDGDDGTGGGNPDSEGTSSGTLSTCSNSGYDACYQYSTSTCLAELSLNYLDSVNDIQWGAVEDESDPYVIDAYQIGWSSAHYAWSGSLSAYVVYYGVSNPEADCGASGCSTGQIYSSPYTLAAVSAPGIASYETVLAYTLVSTGEYCYVYFDPFEPAYGANPDLETESTNTIYVLNCYDADDCDSGEHCNKTGSWETWACEALEADGEACVANEDCGSGYCSSYETSPVCFTPSSDTDSDGDGLSDEEEAGLGTNLSDSDSDDDSLSDYLEVITERSDPTLSDSDSDGVGDSSDLCADTSSGETPDENGCSNDQGRSETKITASDDGEGSENFGGSVSLSGDLLLVGAYQDDDNGYISGSAYIYQWDGDSWEEEKLLASDGTDFHYFGMAVSLSEEEEVALVGTYADDEMGAAAGAAYVYRYDSMTKTWDETKLMASDATDYMGFGYQVVIDGDLAVVGTTGYDESMGLPNELYVFRWDEENEIWNEETRFTPSGGENDWFGTRIAVHDDVIVFSVVGTNTDSGTNTDGWFAEGVVYIYRFDEDENSWYQEAKLEAVTVRPNGYFGNTLSVDYDVLLVGSTGYGGEAGYVSIYRWDGSGWNEEGYWLGSEGGYLGCSAVVDGDLAAVVSDDTSSILLYQWDGSSWEEKSSITPSGSFSCSVSMDKDRLAVSGSFNEVYLYDYILNPTIDTDGDLVADGADAFPYDATETTDTDADGVGDHSDACSDTPADEMADETGCGDSQTDTDGDGVLDDSDLCAGTTDLATVDGEGCSDTQRDSDQDGVLDINDICPETSQVSGLDYVKENSGCAWSDTDTDGDGLTDYEELVTYGDSRTTELYGSDSTDGDYFGTSVAIDEDKEIIVVGAPYHDAQGTYSGAAYVYTWDGAEWQETKLLASDGEAGDQFGISVGIRGDRIAVGAYGEDHASAYTSGTSTGAVYIFSLDGSQWSQQEKVVGDSESFTTCAFGMSIDLDEDHLIVGDYCGGCLKADNTGDSGGAAFVYEYEWDSSSWNLQTNLTADECTYSDMYGWSVSLDGDLAVVGSYADDDAGNGSGSAFVYRNNGSAWNLETKLVPTSLSDLSYFGYAVGVSGDTVAVGAAGDGDESERTYPFRLSSTEWVEDPYLEGGGRKINVHEGSIFTIENSALLYTWDGTSWNEERELGYGQMAVALNDSLLVIGNTSDNTMGSGAGSLVIYDRSDPANTDYNDADSDDDGINDGDEIAAGSNPNDATSTACAPPSSGTDWTITYHCTFMNSTTHDGDVTIQNSAVVTIPSGITLDLDFATHKLVVKSGSGVLIQQGGGLY